MLLVDDRETEPGELDLLLEERVRPDGDLDLAVGDRGDRRAPLPRRQCAGEPRHLEAERPQPLRELAVVLLGEDLGRRHHRRLPAALDGAHRRGRGNDRLAAADVALKETVHRMGGGEVALDLAPRAGLRTRQLERQRARGAGPRARRRARAAARLARAAPR